MAEAHDLARVRRRKMSGPNFGLYLRFVSCFDGLEQVLITIYLSIHHSYEQNGYNGTRCAVNRHAWRYYIACMLAHAVQAQVRWLAEPMAASG